MGLLQGLDKFRLDGIVPSETKQVSLCDVWGVTKSSVDYSKNINYEGYTCEFFTSDHNSYVKNLLGFVELGGSIYIGGRMSRPAERINKPSILKITFNSSDPKLVVENQKYTMEIIDLPDFTWHSSSFVATMCVKNDNLLIVTGGRLKTTNQQKMICYEYNPSTKSMVKSVEVNLAPNSYNSIAYDKILDRIFIYNNSNRDLAVLTSDLVVESTALNYGTSSVSLFNVPGFVEVFAHLSTPTTISPGGYMPNGLYRVVGTNGRLQEIDTYGNTKSTYDIAFGKYPDGRCVIFTHVMSTLGKHTIYSKQSTFEENGRIIRPMNSGSNIIDAGTYSAPTVVTNMYFDINTKILSYSLWHATDTYSAGQYNVKYNIDTERFNDIYLAGEDIAPLQFSVKHKDVIFSDEYMKYNYYDIG